MHMYSSDHLLWAHCQNTCYSGDPLHIAHTHSLSGEMKTHFNGEFMQ